MEEKQASGKKTNTIQVIAGTVVVIGTIWYFWGGGLERETAHNMKNIYSQVSSDSVAQYNIAKRSGNPIDACVHAGMVAAAFLQAQDEDNYKAWKQTESTDCSTAGVPK